MKTVIKIILVYNNTYILNKINMYFRKTFESRVSAKSKFKPKFGYVHQSKQVHQDRTFNK